MDRTDGIFLTFKTKQKKERMIPLTNEIKHCLAYIFDKYADMEPVISGMIGVYLDGFDSGRFTSDVDNVHVP